MVDLHNPNVIGTLTGVDLGSSNKIEQGDTKVQVTDTGGDGLAVIECDGTQIANFTDGAQSLGVSTDTAIVLDQTANTITFKGANETLAVMTGNGSVELYYDNNKVAETTANGITGAVWG